MAVDALNPYITRSSAPIALALEDEWILGFHDDR